LFSEICELIGKINFKMKKIKPYFLALYLLLTSFSSMAGACNCICCHCDRNLACGGRMVGGVKTILQVKYDDKSLLNLKPTAEKSVAATNAAISITQADFLSLAQAGKTWISFEKTTASTTMNIGTANTSSPQIFTLPANLLTNFSNYGRLDFINESSVPMDLQVSGADVAAKRLYIDDQENAIYLYYNLDIDANGVTILGRSFDMYDETDDNFDEEPDYEYFDVPLDLNDAIVSITEEQDFNSNVALTQVKETKTVNGYGTLVLPDGNSADCLRIGIATEIRTRANAGDPFPVNPTSISNGIAFITKQGHYFQAATSAVSGTATLSNLMFRFIQATNTLEPVNSIVKLNNNNKAVTINTTDDTAHSSAILDVNSSNLGVLIPRITMANRPATPTEGLLIYQIDNTAGFYYFDGTNWSRLSTGGGPASPQSRAASTQKPSSSGFASLQDGVAFIKFEKNQDDFEHLKINIQLEGDCNGVFISKKTSEGFEVKELQKGKSNIKFSWSIQ
jgi:hypothetical protein